MGLGHSENSGSLDQSVVSRAQQSRSEVREVMGDGLAKPGGPSGSVVCNRQNTHGPWFLRDYAVTETTTASGASELLS